MKKIVKGIYEWSKMILFALVIAFWLKNNVVASAWCQQDQWKELL